MSFENLFKILPGTRKSLNLSKKKRNRNSGIEIDDLYFWYYEYAEKTYQSLHYFFMDNNKDDITIIILNSNIENIPCIKYSFLLSDSKFRKSR